MIKKLKTKILAVCITVVLIIAAIPILSTKSNKKQALPEYNLVVSIDGVYLKGEMTLNYINTNDHSVNDLYFALYPNAFKSEENIHNVAVSDRINEAYPNGFNEGYIKIIDVSVNNKDVGYSFEENEQILKIDTGEIKENKKSKIDIIFEEKLPDSPMRYGYGESTYNFGNWYPVLCPFENGEAVKLTYISNGDPFYSECADYNVTINMAPEFRLATSGNILSKNTQNPTLTQWQVSGKKLRDFAFVISTDFNLKSSQIGNTLVYSYYLNDDEMGQHALEYAKAALLCFNRLFGEYPYETLSVVAADFYIGGMEYPNMVMIDKTLYTPVAEEALEEVVVHEIAHQWWYGVVGNNETKEAWLDEGLTQYSVALYIEEAYGNERYKSYLRENEIYCKIVFDIVKDVNGSVNKKIDRSSNEFEHWLLYDALTYDVSALMFDNLRQNIGNDNFFNGIRHYYQNNRFKISNKQKFISDMNSGTGKDINAYIEPWLEGNIYWG